jgi:tetratricopeptide (TPR) repeat protein
MRARGTALVVLSAALAACGGERDGAQQKAPAPAAPTDEGARSGADAKAEIAALEDQIRGALDAKDLREAGRLIERGIAAASGGGAELEPSRGRFLLRRGDVARDTGRIIDARRDYADAMALFRVAQLDRGRFEVYLSEAELEEIQGDYAAAERELAEAEELLPKIDDGALRGAYQRQLGRLAFVRSRYADAQALFGEAIKSFSAAKAGRDVAETLLLLAVAEDDAGDTPLARRTLDKALAAFTERGDKDGQVRALHRLAGFAERDGQIGKARTLLTKVRALYEELGRHSDAGKVERHLESLPDGAK